MILTYIILFVVVSAFIDWEHISSNQYIDSHISRGVLRFLFILAVSRDITDFLGMSIFFMATFDGVLNWMRGKE
jgi:hypothetical protein